MVQILPSSPYKTDLLSIFHTYLKFCLQFSIIDQKLRAIYCPAGWNWAGHLLELGPVGKVFTFQAEDLFWTSLPSSLGNRLPKL